MLDNFCIDIIFVASTRSSQIFVQCTLEQLKNHIYLDTIFSAHAYFSVQCDALTSPENGLVNISTNGSASIALYTCVSGYTLEGDAQRSCLTDGSWNLEQPRCGNDFTSVCPKINTHRICISGYISNDKKVKNRKIYLLTHVFSG